MNRRWTDRILGIVLGLVIGLGVLVYFVFVHSEGTIDAPKVNEGGATTGQTTTEPRTTPTPPSQSTPKPPAEEKHQPQQVPVVKVIGGAPPTDAGPKQLTFHKGEKVRFEIETSEPFSFEIKGLGIEQTIQNSSVISFKATKAGQFPVIATATLIGVADLIIKPPR
jgi:heme/copper-type cytochrome/quinol oxidase subunit 2